MTDRKVTFNHTADLIHEYEIQKHNLEEEEDNDTDYEEENEDPRQVLQKLLKNRSFGNEEFGDDYESNVELKRQVEITFNNFQQKNTNSFNIPDLKHLRDSLQIEEKNDMKKIIGKDHDKNLQPCQTCSELMTINYNNCQVCSRETVDVRCTHCVPNLFDLCSPKCREIYDGGISVIEITNDDDEPFLVIEDDGQNMVLTVTNHKLFYRELNQKDIQSINKPCKNCNPDEDNNDDQKPIISPHEEEDIDNEEEKKIKNGVIPIKCYNCSTNYSYLVACGTCYQKSGLQYLCDECENSF
jgi:hypothetical protein